MGIPSPLSSREQECTNVATGVPHPRRMWGAVGDATTRTLVLRRNFFFSFLDTHQLGPIRAELDRISRMKPTDLGRIG